MSKNRFEIGIKKDTTASVGDNAITLSFFDTIQDPQYFDWNTMQMEEGSLVADIVSQVKAYSPNRIMMEIDCMGGDLIKAIAIYNFLKDYPAKVECKILGFCASAATVLACAASKSKLIMPKNGFHITHASSSWGIGGSSKDLRDAADVNDRLTRQMAEILADRNTQGHTAEEIMALWESGDCWKSGEEAEAYGFVDACYNEAAMVTARIDEAKKMFTNAPEVTAEVDEVTDEDINTLTQIKTGLMKFSEKVTAFLSGKKVTAKVTNGDTDITAAVQPLLVEMAAEIETEVTAEIDKVTDAVTVKVTAALDEKYGTKITALETENTKLKTDYQKVIEDVSALVGGESRPGAKETKEPGAKVRPTL